MSHTIFWKAVMKVSVLLMRWLYTSTTWLHIIWMYLVFLSIHFITWYKIYRIKAQFLFHLNEIIPSIIDQYLVNTKYTGPVTVCNYGKCIFSQCVNASSYKYSILKICKFCMFSCNIYFFFINWFHRVWYKNIKKKCRISAIIDQYVT